MNFSLKQKQSYRCINRKQNLWLPAGEGINWEIGVDIHT